MHHRSTIEHFGINKRVFLVGNLVHCNAAAHVWCSLVGVSHAVTTLAATDGFHVQKDLSNLVLTNLCTNEQLAEEIAVSLHLLKLLFCFRVCRSEVTTLE